MVTYRDAAGRKRFVEGTTLYFGDWVAVADQDGVLQWHLANDNVPETAPAEPPTTPATPPRQINKPADVPQVLGRSNLPRVPFGLRNVAATVQRDWSGFFDDRHGFGNNRPRIKLSYLV